MSIEIKDINFTETPVFKNVNSVDNQSVGTHNKRETRYADVVRIIFDTLGGLSLVSGALVIGACVGLGVGAIGLGVAVAVTAVAAVILFVAPRMVLFIAGKAASFALFPLSGSKADQWYLQNYGRSYEVVRSTTIERLLNQSETVMLQRKDGHQVDAVYTNGRNASSDGPTVILFHGNGYTLDGLNELGYHYRSAGVNVLMVTMGGYPGSAEGTSTTEQSLYADVDAAVKFLQDKKGVKGNGKLIGHGHSAGGTMAHYLGYKYPGAHVVGDRTFTKISDMAENVISSSLSTIIRWPIVTIVRIALSQMCPKGFDLDGLDNQSKAAELKGSYLSISGENDQLMSSTLMMGRINAQSYITGQAKLGKTVTIDDCLMDLNRGHNESYNYSKVLTPFIDKLKKAWAKESKEEVKV